LSERKLDTIDGKQPDVWSYREQVGDALGSEVFTDILLPVLGHAGDDDSKELVD
jgi:hypothetical protein